MTSDHAVMDPERQFLGCILSLPARPAALLLDGLGPDDFTDPLAALVAELAIQITAAGRAADPLAVYDAAADHLPAGPRQGRAERLRRLSTWLADTYAATVLPDTGHAAWLKGLLCKATWRRAVTAHATRVLQAAEHCTTSEVHRISTSTFYLEVLWARYQHTANPLDSVESSALSEAA
jgi:hypothetical protein